MADSWIILRTAGRNTLKLAESLTEDGLDCWVPVIVQEVKKRDVRLPMLAGFVFAKARNLYELLDMANMPVKKRRGSKPAHADFSVFHFNDAIPIVADRELNALRRIAKRRTLAPKVKPLKPYQRVRPIAGGFQGLLGTVTMSNERQTIVSFGGLFEKVEISTSLLRLDEILCSEPARKAA